MDTPETVHIGFAPQEGPQVAFIESPCDLTLYGGARGGGKTYASLGDFWIHASHFGQHAVGLMVRKTREALKDTIAIAEKITGSRGLTP